MTDEPIELEDEDLADEEEDEFEFLLAQAYDLMAEDRYEEAERYFRQALKYLETSADSDKFGEAKALSGLSSALFYAGKSAEGLGVCTEILAFYRSIGMPDHIDSFFARQDSADALYSLGRVDEVEAAYIDLIVWCRKYHEGAPQLIFALWNLIDHYKFLGRDVETLSLREEAVELARKQYGPSHDATILTTFGLAGLLVTLGQQDEAIEMGNEAMQAGLGQEHEQIWLIKMAELQASAGNHGQAEAFFLRALNFKVGKSERAVTAHHSAAKYYQTRGRMVEARHLLEKALALMEGGRPASESHGTSISLSEYQRNSIEMDLKKLNETSS